MISRFKSIFGTNHPEPSLSTCTTNCSAESNEIKTSSVYQTAPPVRSRSLLHTYQLQVKVKQDNCNSYKQFAITVAQQHNIEFNTLKSIILEKINEQEKTFLLPEEIATITCKKKGMFFSEKKTYTNGTNDVELAPAMKITATLRRNCQPWYK